MQVILCVFFDMIPVNISIICVRMWFYSRIISYQVKELKICFKKCDGNAIGTNYRRVTLSEFSAINRKSK